MLNSPARALAAFCFVLTLCSLVPLHAQEDRCIPGVQRADGSSFRYVAHRGGCIHAPENTLAAFALAIDWGAEYIEADVRRSADGTHWIMHDTTVDRTTNARGRFDEMSDDQIRTLDAGSWFAPEFTGQRVPTLEELLAWAKGSVRVYLDVKDAHLPTMLECINEAGMRDDVFIWFSQDERARELRRLDATIPLKMNVASTEDVERAVREFNAQLIEMNSESLDAATTRAAREAGLEVMVYTNKPDRQLFERALRMGVDMFNIDHPHVLAEVEAEVLREGR